MPARPIAERDRFLDGLRGVGCTLVVLWHAIGAAAFATGHHQVAQWSLLWFASSWGPGLLDLFFVLSGFFITRILIEHRDSASYFRTFWLRRAARILPAAYAVLFVLVVAWPWLSPYPRESLRYASTVLTWPLWTMTSNVAQVTTGHYFGLFEHYWSVALEEQFYLLWPFAVYALSRRDLERLCYILFAFGPLMRLALAASPYADYALIENQLFTRTGGFAAGALIALYELSGRRMPSRQLAVAGALMLIAVLPDGGVWVHETPTAYWSSLTHTGAVCLSAALVASRHAWRGSWLALALTNPVSQVYGRWSYCLYLVHFPIVQTLVPRAMRWQPADPPLNLLFVVSSMIAMVLLSTAAAALLHYAIERPGLRLYRYLPFAPPAAGNRGVLLRTR